MVDDSDDVGWRQQMKIVEWIQERLSPRVRDNIIIAWLVTKNTLTVVVMALLILSPLLIYPFLLGWPAPYCYVAYAIWISWIIGSIIVAAVIGYLRETQGERAA
ncbi:MAG: hypothetical protein QXX08_05985 [Candidatus Bathyarchaeia archaeon]